MEAAVARQEKKSERLTADSDADFKKWIDSETYRDLFKEDIPRSGLVARYTFDDGTLKNLINQRQAGVMRQLSAEEKPSFEKKGMGKAVVFNGDVWLDLKEVGVFRKSDPFSIGLWVNIPKQLDEGVIFHKS